MAPSELPDPRWLDWLPRALLVLDLVVLGMYLLDNALGHPVVVLESFWDLDRESNLSTWYSSAKFLILALLLGWCALVRWEPDRWRAGVVGAGALLAALLSVDETAIIHERFGAVLLPYGQREETVFREGGGWIMVLAPLLLVAALALWRFGLRDYARRAPGTAWRFALGFGLLLLGAAGVEMLRFFSVGSWWHPIQVVVEEGMEFVGVTLMVAGAVRLVRALAPRG